MDDDDEVQAYIIIADLVTTGRLGIVRELNRWAKMGYRLHTVRGDWYIMEHQSVRGDDS